MDSRPNSVSPLPEPIAPMAEFDKTPPEDGSQGTIPLDELPPPPATISVSIPTSADVNSSASGSAKKKHRHYDDDDDEDMSCGHWCEYVLVVILATLLLLSAVVLVLFWSLYYRGGFAWHENPEKQFNLHPTLMVTGFITLSGFAMLLYRISRCCRHIYMKLFHMLFHALAIPCIVMGFIAVWESKLFSDPPIRNFYSMHSWLGLITMGLFALQFIVGFFSFLILLCCEGATAAFRASLVPIHASFGTTTFMLAVATCLTGLTQKAITQFGVPDDTFQPEYLLMNSIATVIASCGIIVCYTLTRGDVLKYHGRTLVSVEDDI